MESHVNWADALSEAGSRDGRILFARQGVVASFRPLDPLELEECREMGGIKGAKYALYLALDGLKEAGEQLRTEQKILSPLDITDRFAFADIVMAAKIIISASGGGAAMIRLLGEGESAEEALLSPPQGFEEEAPADFSGFDLGGFWDFEPGGAVATGGEYDDSFDLTFGEDDYFAGDFAGLRGDFADFSGQGAAPRASGNRGDAFEPSANPAEEGADSFARVLATKLKDAALNM